MNINPIDHLKSSPSADSKASHVNAATHPQDRLSKANDNGSSYLPSKPNLSRCPNENKEPAVIRFIQFVNEIEQSQNSILRWRMGELNTLQKHLTDTTLEHQRDSHRLKTAQENCRWWSQTGSIISVVTAATSIATGFSLLPNENISRWVSGGMIAAGVGSISATTLSGAGVFPQFSAALALAAGILGVAVGGSSIVNQMIYSENVALATISQLCNCVRASSTCAGGLRKADLIWENKKFDESRNKLGDDQKKIRSQCDDANHLVEAINHLHESAMKFLENQLELMRIAKSVASAA